MVRHAAVIMFLLHLSDITEVYTAKQKVMLSDSYLPVAMQIIAHLTDQMAYVVKDEPVKTTSKPPKPAKPASSPAKPSTPVKPASDNKPSRPSSVVKPTTNRPMYVDKPFEGSFLSLPGDGSFNSLSNGQSFENLPGGGWWMSFSSSGPRSLGFSPEFTAFLNRDATTPFHRPGLYAPVKPPSPAERVFMKEGYLLPVDHNSEYTVIRPKEQNTDEPLLSMHDEEIKPIMEPKPETEEHLLNFHSTVPKMDKNVRSSDKIFVDDEELTDDNLQYLSPDVREMIKMAHDDGERLVDDLGDTRAGESGGTSKAKLSASNLRLLLLYDILSREAKRQKLSDYSGFSQSVLSELVASAGGGARSQLSFALSKMVDRRDCEHEYANNRAREMVAELAKDESVLSSEVRYLEPLVYRM